MKSSNENSTNNTTSLNTEYWILDPELETVKIHRKEKEIFNPPIHLSRENQDRLTTPLLPGFKISLADLFE